MSFRSMAAALAVSHIVVIAPASAQQYPTQSVTLVAVSYTHLTLPTIYSV